MGSGIRSSVHIEGLDQLRKNLRALPEQLQKKALGDAVAKGAHVIKTEAAARAPVLATQTPYRIPGVLRRMIRSTRGIRRDSEASAFVLVRKQTRKALAKFKQRTRGQARAVNPQDAWYWRFLEFGTSKMAARPFLRPAFDTKKEDAARTIKDALREGIEAAAKKLTVFRAGGR